MGTAVRVTRGDLTALNGMDRQTLSDWVDRCNAAGIAGLKSRKSPGRMTTVAMALPLALPGTAVVAKEPYRSCIGSKCYAPDFLGGLGLEPKRHFSIAFGTHEVCGIVRDALNAAIRAGSASLRAVERPLPPAAQTNTWPWHGRAVTTYETRNPIFAADIFLPWNWMGWAPWPGATPQPDDLLDDYSRARWMIAPVFNDGKPLLLTQRLRGGVQVWDVPEKDLDKHDWSDWRSYSGFTLRLSPCAGHDGFSAGPLSGIGSGCPVGPNTFGPMYPRVTKQQQAAEPFAGASRAIAIFYFAYVKQHYYAVLQTPNVDMIIVADPGEHAPTASDYGNHSPDMDLCYLKPSLRN